MLGACKSDGPSTYPSLENKLISIHITPKPYLSSDFNSEPLPLGLNVQYEATLFYSDGSSKITTEEVHWHLSNDNATISTTGLVNAQHLGGVVVEAKNGVKGIRALTISEAVMTNISMTSTNNQLAKGMSLKYTAKGHFSDATTADVTSNVAWKSRSPAIASIDDTGLAKGLIAGSTEIIATLDEYTANATLSVTNATLTAIEITPVSAIVPKGMSLK